MLSGSLENEFGKLPHLWEWVGWKAFTTKMIAVLSLFDTFGILYYMKY